MLRRIECKRCVLIGGLVLCLISSAGCYERTIRADGMGASGVALQKPYVKHRWGDSKKNEFKQLEMVPSKRSSKPW